MGSSLLFLFLCGSLRTDAMSRCGKIKRVPKRVRRSDLSSNFPKTVLCAPKKEREICSRSMRLARIPVQAVVGETALAYGAKMEALCC